MNRAEQRAKEAFPDIIRDGGDDECIKEEDAFLNTKRKSYIKGYQQAIEDAAKWWATVPDDTYYHNPCAGFVNMFKKAMSIEL